MQLKHKNYEREREDMVAPEHIVYYTGGGGQTEMLSNSID